MSSRSPALARAAGAVSHLVCKFDVKSVDGSADSEMRFTGYASTFGGVDSYGDSVARGAFRQTLRDAKKSGVWPAMLSQHGGWGVTAQDLVPVGVWAELDEDDIGLKASGILAATPRGTELHTLMSMKPRAAINGLSIGYQPVKWTINANAKEGEARRTLTEIKLFEISPVTFPADNRARVSAVKSARDLETAFRDVLGMSHREARRAAGAAWRALGRDEPKSELSTLLRASAAKFSQ